MENQEVIARIRELAASIGMEVAVWDPKDGLNHYDEVVESDYLCPECRGPMTSGIQDPEGDYDDWLTKPTCRKCGFVPSSDKSPFGECIPIKFVPQTMKIGAEVSKDNYDTGWCSVHLGNYYQLPTYGSGSMWAGYVHVTEVERVPEESNDAFYARAIKIARGVIESKVEKVKNSGDWSLSAPYAAMIALPAFYFFE